MCNIMYNAVSMLLYIANGVLGFTYHVAFLVSGAAKRDW